MELYADGELVASSTSWQTTQTAVLARTPRVPAVDCLDLGVVGGILLSASNGLHTDGTWRCSTIWEENWNKVRLSSSLFQQAKNSLC